jgi:uncharacterized membrane protein
MNRFRALWWRVSGSLWFVPALLLLGAVGAAVGLVEAEGLVGARLVQNWPRLFGAGAEGARAMLSAIASSMITVAGVVFSVTLVALSLAASQYSPRVLRTFMSDRPTQVVLGVFVSVFAYCLIVLRTIRSGAQDPFVPSLAVLGGIALAFVAIGFLVFFIHHLATAIEVSTIITRISNATLSAMRNIFADRAQAPDMEGSVSSQLERISDWTPVASRATGYVISVEYEGLERYALRHDRTVRMDRGIGEFAVRGQQLASLSGRDAIDDADAEELNACYSMDRERTLEQDPAFGMQQIVDIALKALSPGMNDETTAIMCIDRLAEILVEAARRRIEPRHRMRDGRLAVVVAGRDFAQLVDLCTGAIRDAAAGKRRVLMRLIWLFDAIGTAVCDRHDARVIVEHLRRLKNTAEHTVSDHQERDEIVAAVGRAEMSGNLRSTI